VDPFPGLTRRTVLASTLAIGVLASGCTTAGSAGQRARLARAMPRFRPDVGLALRVLEREQAALALAAASLPGHTALGETVRTVTHVHERHIRVLARALPKGAPRPRSRIPPVTLPVPHDGHQLLLALADRENRLAEANRQSALLADSGALARLLGSMAAAAAQLSTSLAEQALADHSPADHSPADHSPADQARQ
jgi:hypothetical protein